MSELRGGEIPNREHYPYVTRSLLRLHAEGVLSNISDVIVEPDYGYVARITYKNGDHRITYGNDLGLNTGAASDLARDKGHTKFLLRNIGIKCPRGDEFLLPWWSDEIGHTQQSRGNLQIKDTTMAESYIEQELGYPIYLKPVDGSKGADIFVIHGADELANALEIYNEKRVRVAMIEEPIRMPDYRVVTLDGELISAYRRTPLSVIGNGSSTIHELLLELYRFYEAQGRDTRIDPYDPRFGQFLLKQGLTIENVPAPQEKVVLAPISNLSAGGTSEDVTNEINLRWVELAAFIAKNFNLRLCGLDLACENIAAAESEYSVLEVNAAPGLDHYASSGEYQKKIVDDLYIRVFNALPVSTG